MEGPKVEYVGPFDTTYIVIDGREVPHLAARLLPGGQVTVVLDHRYALDLTVAEAERVIPFLADCIAVAKGFASHPRGTNGTVPLPVFRRLTELGEISTDDHDH